MSDPTTEAQAERGFDQQLERLIQHAALAKRDRRLAPSLRRKYARLEVEGRAARGKRGATMHVLEEGKQLIIETPKELTPFAALCGREPFPTPAQSVRVPDRTGHRIGARARGAGRPGARRVARAHSPPGDDEGSDSGDGEHEARLAPGRFALLEAVT
jgi:hypothetical protein